MIAKMRAHYRLNGQPYHRFGADTLRLLRADMGWHISLLRHGLVRSHTHIHPSSHDVQ